jgi:hypothetical protein
MTSGELFPACQCPTSHARRCAAAPVRPATLPDRVAHDPARLRNGGSVFRRHDRAGAPSRGDGARSPARLHPSRAAVRFRPLERADLGAFPLLAPSNQFGLARGRRRRGRDREQVSLSVERQAPLQPDELRAGGGDRDDRQRLGLSRPVGKRRLLRFRDRLCRPVRGATRGPRRRDARLHRRLGALRHGPFARSRGAARDPVPSAGERRAAALRVLHDFRPEDDAGFANRTDPLRRARRRGRGVHPVSAVPAERRDLVPRLLLALRSPVRSAVAGAALDFRRGPFPSERRLPCAASPPSPSP